MYFLEESIGRQFPPATNHPEQYYGFIGVALAWQFAFLLIARDPLRYRPLMLAAVGEKFLPAGAVVYLFAADRVSDITFAPFLLDLAIGLLFLISYFRVRERSSQATTGPARL
jgi:hypothetical protein